MKIIQSLEFLFVILTLELPKSQNDWFIVSHTNLIVLRIFKDLNDFFIHTHRNSCHLLILCTLIFPILVIDSSNSENYRIVEFDNNNNKKKKHFANAILVLDGLKRKLVFIQTREYVWRYVFDYYRIVDLGGEMVTGGTTNKRMHKL